MKTDEFDELKFALSAYDSANAHAMRLWYAAALVSLSVLFSMAGVEVPSFLGESGLDVNSALPALLIILSVLNFIFTVSQISHYRMTEIYQSMVFDRFSELDRVTERFTWRDLALSAPIAGYNRVRPLFEAFGVNPNGIIGKILKFIFDLSFGLFPAVGLGFGLWNLPCMSPFFIFILTIGVVSILSSFALVKYAYLYVKK